MSLDTIKYGGYNGKYLRIDLTSEKIDTLDIPSDWIENYLGGSGFGTKILWDEVLPESDPLSPENRLIFATGPLTGTSWPSSGRLEVISKSPLTGIYGDSNCGGFFAPELKSAGYDLVVIQGKSKKPVYLSIQDEKVELKDASAHWGKSTSETSKAIKHEIGDEKVRVASIGVAGENLVRFACIMSEDRAAARSGLGAVMGYKNLKAVAVRGTKKTKLKNPAKYSIESTNASRKIKNNKFTKGLRKNGTPLLMDMMDKIGRLPSYNFKQGSFKGIKKINGEALKKEYSVKNIKSCFNCPIGCSKLEKVSEGEYKGTITKNLEYETICSLGSKCGNDNLASIIKANEICNDLGIDTTSAGGVISWAMECYENRIFDKETIGFDLKWGDHHSILSLLEKIAKREGFGNLLAEGVKRASEKIGLGSEKYAMHVKGMEIPAQDGRAQQSMGLAQVTSNRGADHLKGFPTIDETGYIKESVERYGIDKLPEIVDGKETKYKPFVVKDGEDFCAVIDSLGVCKFGTQFPPALYWKDLAKAVKYATGMDFDENRLKKTGERIYNLQRLYNIREGISKKDDTLPARFLKEPSHITHKTVQLSHMLNKYYELRGWDKNGIPTKNKLKELRL